jgi:ABC-2 type transport system permease protein
MFELFKIELYKIFRKPRTYIGFVAIAVVVLLIQIAVKADGQTWITLILSSVTDVFEIDTQKVLNGYFVCFQILNVLLLQIPLLVALVTGDLVAGEANAGTLRLLVSKPISRTGIVTAKFLAGLTYTLCLLVWMALLALFVSMWMFGTNDLLVAKSFSVVQIDGGDVFWRYLCAFGFAFIALGAVAALSFMLSVFAENSIGPIVTTMSIILVFTIVTTMNMPLFNRISPFLFTSYMTGWKGFFNTKTIDGSTVDGSVYSLSAVLRAAGILVGHILLFFGVALAAFRKKDILT